MQKHPQTPLIHTKQAVKKKVEEMYQFTPNQ